MILTNKQVGWGGNNSDFLIEDLEDLSDFLPRSSCGYYAQRDATSKKAAGSSKRHI